MIGYDIIMIMILVELEKEFRFWICRKGGFAEQVIDCSHPRFALLRFA